MRKSTRQSANYDSVRRTIYICDIASQVWNTPEPCLCYSLRTELQKGFSVLHRAGGKRTSVQHGKGASILVQVTEAEVAQHFADCGQIMDCRVCGDPNSAMRFAFIEFKEEASVMKVAARPASPLLHCQTDSPVT